MAAAMRAAIAAAQSQKKKKRKDSGGGFHTFDSFNAKHSQAAAHGRAAKRAREESDDDSEEDSEDERKRREFAEKHFDWGEPPTELLSREEVAKASGRCGGSGGAAFVDHFVRWVIGAWRREIGSGAKIQSSGLSVSEVEWFNSEEALLQTQESFATLLRQLEKGDADPHVLSHLERMATLAYEREYAEANKAYMELTMGNKKWQNVFANAQAKHNKGASIKVINQSEPTKYDTDPVAQKYIQALRRMVQFTQYKRPNVDTSKHM